ncbi:iron ABC transporter permease [Victivallaceae bacterium BBE-744-WT-12]|uniref:Iron ABC transporter permease n=1 Tax=Victivallis lenta TaxID=2606640 RepID=A0A844G4X9_9BACT|nr:iron ABC transporter permease [Victivallis lenta]AVM45865.1 iron ABC transporter permease [Victivallales bacterium CCUG 44730]MBS1454692.1 iron ABC transporter permease [Lentisphaeria bacterium]MBS5531705.1 iron ABC transporter permease [bacterium]MST97671.1 iron ABC transporter permease [Victivallis lenta]HBP08638.1 iron ABC transporter permease [Lentisphaeria bacterium]
MTRVFSSLRTTAGRFAVNFALLALLALVMLVSMRFGSLKLTFAEIVGTLWNRPDGINGQIIFNIRLPRILLGALVGGSLAAAGTILQGVMRNPLASPGIIGVSAGGGLGGILVMLVLPQFGYLLVPAAFGGALVTAVLVYLLAWKRGVNPVRLILAGVAVSAMLGAFSSTILILNAEKAGGVLDFTIGSLSARSWPQIEQVAPYMAAGFAVALMLGQKLNILTLGDEVATGLGMRVERTRFLLLAVAALLAASAVSVAGLLGFVGLIAPHIVRIVIGSDNRFLIPASALFGGIMVVGCDTVGRMAMDPSELPVGVIMSLLGPPFFLWLLRRHSYEA